MKKYILCDSEVTYTPLTKKDKMCTVYFPSDCKNDCNFCTSKNFYKKNRPDRVKVLKWLKSLANSDISEIVFTGGEPMSDLNLLGEMLEICKEKNVYINTTFLENRKDEFIDLVNKYDCVKGINVSRHSDSFDIDSVMLKGIARDDEFLKVKTNVRINCFVGEKILKDKMERILSRWEKVWEKKNDNSLDVSFRHDYNTVTPESLHLLDTESICAATEVGEYYGRVYCHACDKVLFKTKRGMDFRIHRGLQNTRVKIGNIIEMQELVLFPDGVLCTDWDKTSDGLDDFLQILNIKKIN